MDGERLDRLDISFWIQILLIALVSEILLPTEKGGQFDGFELAGILPFVVFKFQPPSSCMDLP